ncbi:MAG: glycoside hydrolase family 2 protein [Flavobacteriales bacterium]
MTHLKNISFLILLLSLALNSFSQNQPTERTLHENWQFASKSNTLKGNATVPGNIHTDLWKSEIIEDPYKDTNELDYQWIQDSTWTYTSTFQVNEQELASHQIFLEFEGLDTYATIYLNEMEIGKSDNMFLAWKNEVKTWLKKGTNSLKIVFKSPYEVHAETAKNLGYQLPASNDAGDNKISPWVRKAPYHFGWDWAPKFTTCGIYMPVKMLFKTETFIEDVYIYTSSISEEKAVLEYEITLNQSPEKLNCTVELSNTKGYYFSATESPDFKTIKGKITLDNPEIWWPNGWGEQPLYDFHVGLGETDKFSQKVGLRMARIRQQKDDTGESFHFEVNGNNLVAKGANYIPQDVFINQKSDEDYERLILQAKNANFNMLRVWGGGVYERDIFYELCDKHGILIWQDFMFACSMYPYDKSFIESVKAEVRFQVKRLRNHACIAHWNGNNEIAVAWDNWGWQSKYSLDEKTQRELLKGYQTLFEYAIPNTVYALDKRTYTHTSPLSNWGAKGDFNSGSMHYWGIWHNREPLENYADNVGRFMAEYGFQSFPSIELLKRYIPEDSLFLASESMTHRQKSYIGNAQITERILDYFPEPTSFEEFLEMSQLTQAIAYEQAIEAHRKKRPHCMGTLYWQLNDCWPGPSWSTIDYGGELKSAHYKVREMYQNVLPIIEIEKERITTYISNDTNEGLICDIKTQLIEASTGKILKIHFNTTPIDAMSTSLSNITEEFLKVASTNYYIHTEVYVDGEMVSKRNVIPDWYTFSRNNDMTKIKKIFLSN